VITERVLVDAGPLVAVFSATDKDHAVCTETLGEIRPPLLTCWAVIAEAAWLLRRRAAAVRRLLEVCEEGGFVELLPISGTECPEIRRILAKYEDPGTQLADASVVYLADREKIDKIFTLDRRHFSVYRRRDGKAFELLP
jgi:predicted nucleic acid-binding protein